MSQFFPLPQGQSCYCINANAGLNVMTNMIYNRIKQNKTRRSGTASNENFMTTFRSSDILVGIMIKRKIIKPRTFGTIFVVSLVHLIKEITEK